MTDNKPEVKVRGRRQAKTTETREDKIKHSQWLWTFNPNIPKFQDGDADLEEQEAILSDACEDLLHDIGSYVKFTHEKGDHKWSSDIITNAECDHTVERGGKRGQLHAHMLIKISHRSKISLDYAAMKARLCEDLGIENAYTNAKLVRATGSDFLLAYLNKGRDSA